MNIRKAKIQLISAVVLYILFVVFTMVVMNVDVKPIGFQNSTVGLATLNGAVHSALGLNTIFYSISKYMGALVLLWVPIFAAFGLYQLIHRKSLAKVDGNIYAMGGLYILVAAFYVLFEIVVINYRPVDMGEGLEASYPSSHTMLAIAVCGSAMIQIWNRFYKKPLIKYILLAVAAIEMLVVVVGRFLSGVHWTTDMIAGIILGLSLLVTYWGMDRALSKDL